MTATPDKAERIRTRAYSLWEEAGRPSGREHEFWAQATAEIGDEDGPQSEPRGDNRFIAR